MTACSLSDDADARIDIGVVARILLKVIREFQRKFPDGVVFTRVKDVITCVTVHHPKCWKQTLIPHIMV